MHYSYVVNELANSSPPYYINRAMHAKIIALCVMYTCRGEQQEQPSDVHRLCVTFMITVSSVFL